MNKDQLQIERDRYWEIARQAVCMLLDIGAISTSRGAELMGCSVSKMMEYHRDLGRQLDDPCEDCPGPDVVFAWEGEAGRSKNE